MTAPHAPWRLLGECLIGVVRSPGGALPPCLRRLPGPAMVIAASYADSPVGPYEELTVLEPARLGARPGMCATTAVVNSADARVGGVLNWGFPTELGALEWSADGDDRELRWDERAIVVRGSVDGVRVPLLVPIRNVQRRSDGPVVVPTRLRGRATITAVCVDVPQGDPLSAIAGTRRGVHVAGARMVMDPARSPVGLASTLRAPLRAPEPAVAQQLP